MIPFSKPFFDQREADAVAKVLQTSILHGDGPVSRRVQDKLREWTGARYVYLTTSCTHALEMAMLTLGVGLGDEVIMPSFTFVSTANAVVLRGAKPVFAEIREDTLNIDPDDIERKITPRTKAIIPVHYAGVGCEMDRIMEIAREHNLSVVEDAAQGVDAKYNGKYLGTVGDIGCYSFHDTKNITCGEGGAFLTNDEEIAKKAELIREKGTNRSAFLRGEIDKYTWVSEGSSYIQSEVLAALLEVQLAKKDEIKEKRRGVWRSYYGALKPLEEKGLIKFPKIPESCEQNYHIFCFRVATEDVRGKVIDSLKAEGIQATFHYVPLHSSPFGRDFLGCKFELPVTEECSRTLVRLPLYPQLCDSVEVLVARVKFVIKSSLPD